MRDPKHTALWSENLAVRVQYQESQSIAEDRNARSQSLTPKFGLDAADLSKVAEVDSLVGDDSKDVQDSFDFDTFLSKCEVMRCSSTSLDTLRSLPPASLVLLLTPVVTLKTTNSRKKSNEAILNHGLVDPFESLGRELSQFHPRLRHVPYVPQVGMTKTHAAFIEEAAAVVTVICEPDSHGPQSLAHQQAFANEVLQTTLDYLNDDDAPFVLIRFGGNDEDCISDHRDFRNVLYGSFATETNMEEAARLLFETKTSRLEKKAAKKTRQLQVKTET